MYPKHTKTAGSGGSIEAQHLCMQMRGIQKQHSITTTSDFTGAFEKTATPR
jgi:GTP cyclohydrolase I